MLHAPYPIHHDRHLQNATIWTGAGNGFEVIRGNIMLDGGLIKRVGEVDDFDSVLQDPNFRHLDAQGKWVSPG